MTKSETPGSRRRPYTPEDHRRLAERETDPAVLRRLSRGPHPFVRRALAENPAAPPDVLAALCAAEDAPWNRNLLLLLVARHPRADRAVLCAARDHVADLLASGERPYAAALALAAREELAAAEIRPLGTLRGASRRLRRGLARVLAAGTGRIPDKE